MAFIEIEFPRRLALMAVGGPGYNTTVNPGFSGYEQRNQNWAQARAEYSVSFENKTIPQWTALESMFHAARGQANAFRLFDPGDFSATGQFIANGDGVKTAFQLQKKYSFPVSSFEVIRPVQKLITSFVQNFQSVNLTNTVNVYLNGTLQTHSSDYHTAGGFQYTLDETTGVITFSTAPGSGVVITADYQYHIPVRFMLDQMQKQFITGINGSLLVTVTGIKLIEVRIKPGSAS